MIISHKYKFIFIKTTKVGGTSVELFLDKICGVEDILTPHWHNEKNYIPRNYHGYFNPLPEILRKIYFKKYINYSVIEKTLNEYFRKEKYFESIPAWQLKNRVSRDIWDNYYKFTIERNPWDKAVSRYFHSKEVFEKKYRKELTYEMWFKYLRSRLKKPQITKAWGSEAPYNFPRYTNPSTDEVIVDKICRYEELNQELAYVFTKLNIPFEGKIKYKAKSHYRKDRRHYSEFLSSEQRDEITQLFKKEIELMNYTY